MSPSDPHASHFSATVSQRVAAELRRRILHGELLPGQRLKIDELAAMCAVSHMPIRQALGELEGEGVLEVTMPLPEPRVEAPEGPPSLRGNGLHRLLSKVAAQMVNVQLGRRLLAHLRGESQEG